MDNETIASFKQKYPNIFEHFKSVMSDDIIAEGIKEFDSKSHEELVVIAMENVISRVLLERTANAVKAIGGIMGIAAAGATGKGSSDDDDLPKA